MLAEPRESGSDVLAIVEQFSWGVEPAPLARGLARRWRHATASWASPSSDYDGRDSAPPCGALVQQLCLTCPRLGLARPNLQAQ